MARQIGLIKLKGVLGDVVFYHTKDGYLARAHDSARAKLMKHDARFKRTRAYSMEFGAAIKAATLLRRAFRQLEPGFRSCETHRRLNRLFLQIKNEDAKSICGERTVQEGLKTKTGQALLVHALKRISMRAFDFASATIDFRDGSIRIRLQAKDDGSGRQMTSPFWTYITIDFILQELSISHVEMIESRATLKEKKLEVAKAAETPAAASENKNTRHLMMLGSEFNEKLNNKETTAPLRERRRRTLEYKNGLYG